MSKLSAQSASNKFVQIRVNSWLIFLRGLVAVKSVNLSAILSGARHGEARRRRVAQAKAG